MDVPDYLAMRLIEFFPLERENFWHGKGQRVMN